MVKDYYIFGLQRSGTNFLEQILEMNFFVNKMNKDKKGKKFDANEICWKHSIFIPTTYDKEKTAFMIHKNPYTWVESICFRQSEDWLKRQKKFPANSHAPDEYKVGLKKLNIINLCKTYKFFSETWMGNKKTHLIKYEDLLDQEKRSCFLEDIYNKYQLERKNNEWKIPERGEVPISDTYDITREQYYLNMKPERLTDNQITKIGEVLGKDLITKLGYEVL